MGEFDLQLQSSYFNPILFPNFLKQTLKHISYISNDFDIIN